ncbi:VOC family protein [Fodinicola acaciae]|uniref:VOC family protein n=1 Tax=Fodinicola acaciae TaxID=2681555 RepID=UPI0013D6B960|nr:VOC family protein [Fodinicola acaciae]
MTDPLDVLRGDPPPVTPREAFTAQLRRRLEAVILGGEQVITQTSVLTPYIAVRDARAAMDWYGEVFGAERQGDLYEMPDGRIGHAQLLIGGAQLFLADEYPEMGLVGPQDQPTRPFSLHLTVTDVDDLSRRAEAAGATVERQPSDNPYGRVAVIIDPFGHRWMLNQ